MSQVSRPWQSTTPGDAGPYSSEQWRTAWKYMIGLGAARGNVGPFLGSGTQPNDGLKVQAQGTPSNQVDILPGSALVQGAFYLNDGTVSLTIAGNASGFTRIDTIILRADYAAQTVRLIVLQGTPSGSPVPPTLTQSAGVTWEIPLADITVANGFTSITNANIQPRQEWANAPAGVYLDSVLNNSGGVLQTGDVVIYDSSTDRAATTTTTADDRRLMGVWVGRTANGGYGRVLVEGIGYVNAGAAVTRGNILTTSTTAKRAAVPSTSSVGAVIGRALETTSGAGLVVCHIHVRNTKVVTYVRVTDQKSSGTAAASVTSGAWRTRELNTEEDPDGLVTVASNQMTLQPGVWLAFCTAEALVVANTARLRLQNITDGATLVQGNNNNNSATPGASTLSLLGAFSISAAKVIELQHYSSGTGAGGTALTSGENEVYAEVFLVRIGEVS